MPSYIRNFLAFVIASFALGSSIVLAQEESITKMFSVAAPNSVSEADNSDWAFILNRYISTGPTGINRFNYAAVTTVDHDRLNHYVASLEKLAWALARPRSAPDRASG